MSEFDLSGVDIPEIVYKISVRKGAFSQPEQSKLDIKGIIYEGEVETGMFKGVKINYKAAGAS